MIADKYIYAKLTADAGVTALVSTRIYPVFIPQDAEYPAITYSAVYTPADNTKTDDATHDNCALTLRCWAAKYDDATEIDIAVRAAIDYVDLSGAGVSAGGVTVDVCEWVSSTDGLEEGNSAPGGAPYFFREALYNIREKR
jgi:hypothetical protein